MNGSLLKGIIRAIESSDQTRYEIAKGSGVSQSHLSRMVRGESGCSIENAERLADYLRLEIVIRPKRGARKGR